MQSESLLFSAPKSYHGVLCWYPENLVLSAAKVRKKTEMVGIITNKSENPPSISSFRGPAERKSQKVDSGTDAFY